MLDVAHVGLDAAESQDARPCHGLGERHRVGLGRGARSAMVGEEIDDHVERLPRGARGGLDLREVARIVDHDGQAAVVLAIERKEPLDLGGRHLWRGDVHARHAAADHDLRLAHRGAADAEGTRRHL